ncbi:hypothetical protein V5O48_000467 [Marasmius crinis-equi]|uniref:Uncharacterized protein n=1 Tax=Marasmius crinis-equi TaxID=585013 RepID=A0ABR3G121_9AGAR
MRLPPALLSRGLDPVLGVFSGVLAYYLYETHPRTALPHDQTLRELIKWKWSQHKESKLPQSEQVN